jgi:hypothetical protein
MNTTTVPAPKHVGLILVDISDKSDDDGSHFRAEMAETCYAKCGLRVFTGEGHVGGYDHVYGEGSSRQEAVTDLVKTLRGLSLTGVVKVRQ